MIIKIGDTITDDTGRTGELKSIGIATDKSDVAGELGLKAKEYDTDLNYTGAITFGTNSVSYTHLTLPTKRIV